MISPAHTLAPRGRPRRWIALLAALLLGLAAGDFGSRARVRPPASLAGRPVRIRSEVPGPPRRPEPATERAAVRLDRADVIRILRELYRREQLTRELDLEQQRYAAAYWEADRDGTVLARLRRAHATLVNDLAAEANGVLAALAPPAAADGPLRFTPLFDDDHPGPNLAFLSDASRRRFEDGLLAADAGDAGQFAAVADRTLSGMERDLYHAWNDRPNAALRDQLAGFHPTEREYLIVMSAMHGPDGVDPAAALEAQLGTDRYRELRQLTEPATSTAMHDLRRAGLSPTWAPWLAGVRQAASTAVQAVWGDPSAPAAVKQVRATEVEAVYARTIATALGLPVVSVDELPRAP